LLLHTGKTPPSGKTPPARTTGSRHPNHMALGTCRMLQATVPSILPRTTRQPIRLVLKPDKPASTNRHPRIPSLHHNVKERVPSGSGPTRPRRNPGAGHEPRDRVLIFVTSRRSTMEPDTPKRDVAAAFLAGIRPPPFRRRRPNRRTHI